MNALVFLIKYQTEKVILFLILPLVSSIILWIILKKTKFCKNQKTKSIMIVLLFASIMIIIECTMLFRTKADSYQYNFDLFWKYKELASGTSSLIFEILANIIVFVPIGALLPCVLKQSVQRFTVVYGILLSSLIELVQLVSKYGLFEVNDIFHNSLGVIIGYTLFCVLKSIRSDN